MQGQWTVEGHVGRLREALLYVTLTLTTCSPPHAPARVQAQPSVPPSVADAGRGETCNCSRGCSTDTSQAPRLAGAPVSTSRGAAKGLEETGTSTYSQQNRWRPSKFHRWTPTPTLKGWKHSRGAVGDPTNRSPISGVLSSLAITSKTLRGSRLVEMPHHLPKGRDGLSQGVPWERWARFVLQTKLDSICILQVEQLGKGGVHPEVEAPRDRQKNASSLAGSTPGRRWNHVQ